MGDASSVRLAIAPEVTFGVNPGTGFDYLRFTREALRMRANAVQSQEIDPLRQPAGSTRVSKAVEGSIDYELSLITPAASPGTGFDQILEGCLMNSWTTPIALTTQTIDIENVVGGTFDLDDTHVSDDAFIDAVVGQWLKLTGFTTNGTIYAYVVSKGTNGLVSCAGVRATGAAVTAEVGTGISISGSMLRIGNTKKGYSIVRHYTDLSVPEFSLYTGCRFGQWTERLSPEGIVGGTFTLQGKVQATTTSNPAGTPTAKWATPRINTTDGMLKQKMLGSFEAISTARIAEIGFTLDNRLRADLELFESGPADIGISTPTLEGNLVAYMANADMVREFEQDAYSKLAYRYDDGTRQQIRTFPRIKWTDAPAVAEGNDRTVRVAAAFAAETDDNGVAFQIDRF